MEDKKKKEEKELIFVLLGLIFGYFFKKIGLFYFFDTKEKRLTKSFGHIICFVN